MRQKRIRESFCLHLGRSQYMFGDYYSEFGEMVKRRFFRRLITSRVLEDFFEFFFHADAVADAYADADADWEKNCLVLKFF